MKTYCKTRCHICGKSVSANGLAITSHLRAHVRAGLATERRDHNYVLSFPLTETGKEYTRYLEDCTGAFHGFGKFPYDCDCCKLRWNCGFGCHCQVVTIAHRKNKPVPDMPASVVRKVNKYRKSKGLTVLHHNDTGPNYLRYKP